MDDPHAQPLDNSLIKTRSFPSFLMATYRVYVVLENNKMFMHNEHSTKSFLGLAMDRPIRLESDSLHVLKEEIDLTCLLWVEL